MAHVKVARMKVLEDSGNLLAYADIVIAEKVKIFGCRLLKGENGLWVAMPSQKGNEDKWYDHVKILDENLKGQVNESVRLEYEKEISSQSVGAGQDEPF